MVSQSSKSGSGERRRPTSLKGINGKDSSVAESRVSILCRNHTISAIDGCADDIFRFG